MIYKQNILYHISNISNLYSIFYIYKSTCHILLCLSFNITKLEKTENLTITSFIFYTRAYSRFLMWKQTICWVDKKLIYIWYIGTSIIDFYFIFFWKMKSYIYTTDLITNRCFTSVRLDKKNRFLQSGAQSGSSLTN